MLELKIRQINRYADVTEVKFELNEITFTNQMNPVTKEMADAPSRVKILEKEIIYQGDIANTREERNDCLRAYLYNLAKAYAAKNTEILIPEQQNNKSYFLDIQKLNEHTI